MLASFLPYKEAYETDLASPIEMFRNLNWRWLTSSRTYHATCLSLIRCGFLDAFDQRALWLNYHRLIHRRIDMQA
jgi:hypothetical protein